jgi:hypothetical protein
MSDEALGHSEALTRPPGLGWARDMPPRPATDSDSIMSSDQNLYDTENGHSQSPSPYESESE